MRYAACQQKFSPVPLPLGSASRTAWSYTAWGEGMGMFDSAASDRLTIHRTAARTMRATPRDDNPNFIVYSLFGHSGMRPECCLRPCCNPLPQPAGPVQRYGSPIH